MAIFSTATRSLIARFLGSLSRGDASDHLEPNGFLVIESASGMTVPVPEPLGLAVISQLGTAEAITAVDAARRRLGIV